MSWTHREGADAFLPPKFLDGPKAPPMNVRAATAQDAAGIVDLAKASNPHGDWYRDPFRKLGRARYEDLTPAERFFHGGSWMDLSLFRRHFHEYQRRGMPVFVAEDRGRVVGECEVWLDEEPAPFGRYAEVELLESGSPPNPEAERALLEHAAERARKMGYPSLDISPIHSGGESVAADLGFAPFWDTRTFAATTSDVPRPDEEFTTRFLAGDYEPLRPLLNLNHREPSRYRYENLCALWPTAKMMGLDDARRVVAVIVAPAEDPGFAVVAARWDWYDPSTAQVDLWIHPPVLKKRVALESAFVTAVEIARKLGTERVTTFAPPAAAKILKKTGFTGGDEPDPWLRRTL